VLIDHAPDHAAVFSISDPASSYSVEKQITLAGVLAESGDDVKEHTGWPQSTKEQDGASKGTPFYRKPSFLISMGIAFVVGIGLLFLLLYPVVGAIAQQVVNASKLNVDRVAITGPTNTS